MRIEATAAGTDLASALRENDADDNVLFWWLGQAGFALKCKEQLLLIDPYLSDSLAEKHQNSELRHERMIPVPATPEMLDGCTWYLCTHGHTDHMDPHTIRGIVRETSPSFVVPRAEIVRGLERGIPADKMHSIGVGECLELSGDIIIEAVASAHEHLDVDEQGNHMYLGYVLSCGAMRLYHSGDCVPYVGLERQLSEKEIDIAFLPVNGRDQERLSKGIPGNFTLREAIELCKAASIPLLVCHHFGMFSFNTIDRNAAEALLQELAGSLDWVLPDIGLTYWIRLDDKN